MACRCGRRGSVCLGVGSVGCYSGGLLLHTVALFAPYWEQAEEDVWASHSGLWSVCILDRCGHLRPQNTWAWFQCVQFTFLVSALCQLSVLGVAVCRYVRRIPDRYAKHATWLIGAGLPFISGVLSVIAVSVYACHQGAEGNWDTLSWAYVMAVLASICQLLTALFFVLRQILCAGVRNLKPNATPLISPASSMLSLDEIPASPHPPSRGGSDQVRMRVSESTLSVPEDPRREHAIAALIEQTFSFDDL